MEMELFFLGLVLTLLFVWATGYYPGGLIVPGYLVLFVNQPLRLAGTLAAALVAWLLYRLASRYLILFGQRRFVFLILTGALAALLLTAILPRFAPEAVEFRVIGWVIPGLLASHTDRQGPLVTLASAAVVVTVLFFTGKLWFLIF